MEVIEKFFNIMKEELEKQKQLKQQYKATGLNLYFVYELVECSYKKVLREKYPDLEKANIYNPRFVIGKMIEEIIRNYFGGNKIVKQKSVDNDIILAGAADIVKDNKIIEVKYQTALVDVPLKHHVLQLQLYLWLFEFSKGELLYISPEGIRAIEVEKQIDLQDVLALIKQEKIPRWPEWECSYCIFNQLCPYSVKKK